MQTTPAGAAMDHSADSDVQPAVPPEFARALSTIRAVRPRPEVSLEEIPGPRRLAPYAAAFSADVVHDERELATGRLVVLHDPDGQPEWDGTLRMVTYLRAELDPEMAADPLLVRVGWSWLTDALQLHEAPHRAAAGTVTRSVSESFGTLDQRPDTTEMELRASWTPADAGYAAHVRAWCDVLATAAGFPPMPPGVAPLRTPSPQ